MVVLVALAEDVFLDDLRTPASLRVFWGRVWVEEGGRVLVAAGRS